jgi:hypothetical protein
MLNQGSNKSESRSTKTPSSQKDLTTPPSSTPNPYAVKVSRETQATNNPGPVSNIDIKRETWKLYGHLIGLYGGVIGLLGSSIGLVNGLLATNSLSTALTASMFFSAFLSAWSGVKFDRSNKIINQARKQAQQPPNE